MVQIPPRMSHTNETSYCVRRARKQVKLHMKRIRQREYCKLRDMVPAIAHKKSVDKVTVIEEAVRYIDELHRALAERLQMRPDFRNINVTEDNVKYFVQDLMSKQMPRKSAPSPPPRLHVFSKPVQSPSFTPVYIGLPPCRLRENSDYLTLVTKNNNVHSSL